MRTALLCLFVAVGSTSATELTPERILDARRLSDLQLSLDGTHLAFTVTEPVDGTEQNRDVWVLDIETRELRPFTGSKKSDRPSPAGHRTAATSASFPTGMGRLKSTSYLSAAVKPAP